MDSRIIFEDASEPDRQGNGDKGMMDGFPCPHSSVSSPCLRKRPKSQGTANPANLANEEMRISGFLWPVFKIRKIRQIRGGITLQNHHRKELLEMMR